MVDSRIPGEIAQLVAVGGKHGGAGEPANDLQMMTCGDGIDFIVVAVNDHARARQRVTRLMREQVERKMRLMTRRAFESERRGGDERDGDTGSEDGSFWAVHK